METGTDMPAEIALIPDPLLREYLREQIEEAASRREVDATRRLIRELIPARGRARPM